MKKDLLWQNPLYPCHFPVGVHIPHPNCLTQNFSTVFVLRRCPSHGWTRAQTARSVLPLLHQSFLLPEWSVSQGPGIVTDMFIFSQEASVRGPHQV